MSESVSAATWIERLGLQPHPEGGWYRETYRAAESVAGVALPDRFDGDRCFCTGIYFLLESGQVSALHRVQADEMWHHYAGGSATLHLLTNDGATRVGLGLDPARGQEPQRVVPGGTWFGATVDEPDSYVLVGCTVAPGFEFADFELGTRAQLLTAFPDQRDLIHLLTGEETQ